MYATTSNRSLHYFWLLHYFRGGIKKPFEVRSGDWTISKSEAPGKVEFSLIEHHHGGKSSHELRLAHEFVQGVDFSKPGVRTFTSPSLVSGQDRL